MSTYSKAAMATSREERADSLSALHRVEQVAASPGLRRPDAWRDDLLLALDELDDRLYEQHRTSAGAGGLLTELLVEAPHLSSSVAELLSRLDDVREGVLELKRELADFSRPLDIEAVRYRLADITREVRELRAWETEIVYEACSVDLGVGD